MRHLYEKVLVDSRITGIARNLPYAGVSRDDVPAKISRGLRECKRITRTYGTSFFFATQFFPSEIRDGIYAVYAFARIPDEIVDDPANRDPAQKVEKLDEWRITWRRAMKAGKSDDPILAAIIYIFEKYQIPFEDCEAFLSSMSMDNQKFSYENYDELEEYMYGSAAVIGLMVTRIVGFHTPDAFPYAEKLGYAFQLTNFLRDIKEDSQELGRIYMPKNELADSDLTLNDISSQVYDDRFVGFMKSQIARNRKIYRDALPGIGMLKWRGRFAVRISYVLYKAILTEIEKANYNVYLGRVRTSFRQKLWLTLKAFAGIYD